ncbi:hypothetical protein Poli38472_007698 [Pythium oligandrum]|uniref:non-specific serine/threonine protein kinase n=1 Tax=Pythium oligandrum TaxID=41045 RepID=A0A8K1FMA4_PYTOL|nr:hypothetical protein Poli38472_007698 [Pythium oligandrum]|eukprot:TMW68026.1 hypothetical protein Poli38472_007698 [Pythium oligandrum]
MEMKRTHADASTAVVIQPRLSLGGKQASSDDVFHKKRLSVSNATGGANSMYEMNICGQVPPLHPHHLSAIDAARIGSSGVLNRSNSVASASAGITSNSSDVLLSGMLTKRGHIFKTWLPRFFVLTKSSLTYYRKNPATLPMEKDMNALEKRLLRGEIFRGDVIRVEATDIFKDRPFTFVIVVHKRSRRARMASHSALSCMFVHYKESRLTTKKRDDGPVSLYYVEARREQERKKWMKAIQRWIDGEHPAKYGRAVFDYIVNNEYSSYRYEQKVCDQGECWGPSSLSMSPAAQAGRKIEENHPVLASLIRDMHECQDESEMVFILDQILGEVKDGASGGSIKKLISSAGEVKLQSSPVVWTQHVKAAYGKIMKALHTSKRSSSGVPSYPMSGLHRSTTLKPTILAPTRQMSDGGENASESSFHRAYKLGRKLGSGAFSVVHIATHRETKKQVAVKCISKASLSKSDVIALKHEVEIMSTLSHPNIVPLLDYFEESRYYYIVTPLCTGGELFDALVKRKSYTEEDARALMVKLTSAIMYIHSRGIVHRDLKPENILLKTSAPGAELMIADFGFARSMRGEKRWTACGTPGYVAPEVVRGEAYGSEVDCWSLGVILFILLCGYPPFGGENHAAIFEKVVSAKYKFSSPEWDDVSESAMDLVRKLLTVDRSKRLTAAGVLRHPWMNPSSEPVPDNGEEKAPLPRVNSDLLSALNQMRKHSVAHGNPKIRPSDMNVDVIDLNRLSIECDVELLDRELCSFEF